MIKERIQTSPSPSAESIEMKPLPEPSRVNVPRLNLAMKGSVED